MDLRDKLAVNSHDARRFFFCSPVSAFLGVLGLFSSTAGQLSLHV